MSKIQVLLCDEVELGDPSISREINGVWLCERPQKVFQLLRSGKSLAEIFKIIGFQSPAPLNAILDKLRRAKLIEVIN